MCEACLSYPCDLVDTTEPKKTPETSIGPLTKDERTQLLGHALDYALEEHPGRSLQAAQVLVDYVNDLIAQGTENGAQGVPEDFCVQWIVEITNLSGERVEITKSEDLARELHKFHWQNFPDLMPILKSRAVGPRRVEK